MHMVLATLTTIEILPAPVNFVRWISHVGALFDEPEIKVFDLVLDRFFGGSLNLLTIFHPSREFVRYLHHTC